MKKRNIKQSYNRILEISDDATQITLPDSRYYRRNGKYYPSVTYVLGYYPKGKFFENWLKQVGFSADYIVKKAAEEGTQVHELAEAYLNGEELNFLDERGRPQYNPDVWQMFLRFVEFWETFKPTLIETEVHIFSDELKVAGTCDLIVEINGELWLLDLKTSNSLHKSYDLQLASYAKALEESKGIKIDRTGILWLKANTRSASNKKGVYQGKGWQVKVIDEIDKNFELFQMIYKLY